MPIINEKGKTHIGEVISIRDHYWMDGMVSEYALVWNRAEQKLEEIQYGYYGSDCCNLMGYSEAEIDLTEEVARDYLKSLKSSAWKAYQHFVIEKKEAIEKGTHAVVVKGRKVPKGTKLEVFWVGERADYTGRYTELIAGCWDENHNKVWVKAEYLKSTDKVKSPVSAERKKFLKSYIRRTAGSYVCKVAEGRI